MTKLSYINNNGDTVFTSQYYRNKGTCCKSACLHCPYFYTLNNIGLKLEDINTNNETEAKLVYQFHFEKDSVTSSLLASAFGNSAKKKFSKENFRVLTLKGFVCGIVELKNDNFSEYYLKSEFMDQGISETYVLGLFNI
jgi:hypothetical protein